MGDDNEHFIVIDESFTNISLNQRTDNVTWGKLRLKSAQNKEREKTLRLSNKYDFKHLNYYEESSKYFTEETIEAPENGSSSDEARNIETVQNMQQVESDGELEELNKTVLLNTLMLVKNLWFAGFLLVLFLFYFMLCFSSTTSCDNHQRSIPLSCALDGYVELANM